jgi:aryl-alcohol dehydrogenase-like predicted oxidoreductase
MSGLSRIGLGTVQFGMDYGVSNSTGRPQEPDVAAILGRAVGAGIRYLDTAAAYGDAEALIGRHLPRGHRMRIVTKTPSASDLRFSEKHRHWLIGEIAASCERLRVDRLYGVLLHAAADLAKDGSEHLVAALHEVKSRGWVERIGVSVYDADELALAESCFCPELVQLPFNALDRRFVAAGRLQRLKASGAEVHARSVFLQGLLLMEPTAVPESFAPVRTAICSLRARWTAQHLSAVAGCLQAVLSHPEIDVAIVGVNRLSELNEIEAAMKQIADRPMDVEPPAMPDPVYLDPRRWPPKIAPRESAP